VEDRFEAARQVVRRLNFGERWEAALDPDMPADLDRLARGILEAYARVDLDWLLEHCDPDIEIVQMAELPDTHSYHGRDGYIEALLDWPRMWDDFRIRPNRIFAPDDAHFIVHATHSGRARTVGIEMEAEIYFLIRGESDRITNWDMFMTEEQALRRAAERRTHRHDDHAAQGDRRERA
jgi:ketosteroid isomerase-like protein